MATRPHVLAIVAEDRLTEAVIRKCVSVYLPEFKIARSDVLGGRGNVQRTLRAYARLALVMPVIAGVDLDGDECAPRLLDDWQPLYERSDRFVLRVAVREIESWVLADRRRVAQLLSANSDDIGRHPDLLEDPKRFLLNLARESAAQELKRDLIPRNFAQYPRIGPAYNLRMGEFVAERWRPAVALRRSDSLARAVRAIQGIGELPQ